MLPLKVMKKIPELRLWCYDEKAIAKILGIKFRDVRLYENSIKIRHAMASGASSAKAIAEQVGLKENRIRHYAKKGNIKLPKKSYKGEISPQQKAELVKQAVTSGEKSLEKLCEISHLTPYGFRKLCKEYKGIVLPTDPVPYRFRPKMDAVIDRGGTLKGIGAAEGVKRPTAWEYLLESHQVEYWKNKVEELKQISSIARIEAQQQQKQKLEIWVKFLHSYITQLYQKESWAVQQALQYVNSLKNPKKSPYNYSLPNNRFNTLVKLLERYEQAKKSGKKSSFRKLGNELVPYESEAQRILRRLGLKSLFWTLRPYTQEEEYAIQMSSRVKMPSTDIGYLLDIPESTISYHRRKIRKKPKFRNYIVMVKEYKTLTYKLASQIYEAYALGIRRYSDIAELLDTSMEIIKYAMDNKKKEIAPPIIQVLRNRYGPKYDKPYKK